MDAKHTMDTKENLINQDFVDFVDFVHFVSCVTVR
jgi:hypothetical protein